MMHRSSTKASLESLVLAADLVIGAVLVAGSRAPRLVTPEMVRDMRPGSVIVDVAIDQGGSVETARPTTHEDPTYIVDGVVHYCVANMPGAVPKTSTYALNNVTLPFVVALADRGIREALIADDHLLNGLNVCRGVVTEAHVAEALDLPYVQPAAALAHHTIDDLVVRNGRFPAHAAKKADRLHQNLANRRATAGRSAAGPAARDGSEYPSANAKHYHGSIGMRYRPASRTPRSSAPY